MARYLIAAALVAAVTTQATVGRPRYARPHPRSTSSHTRIPRSRCAHAHVAKLPSQMQIRPDTKPAGWWQQSGWAPPSARTPLVANLVSTGCLPDSALPSTGRAPACQIAEIGHPATEGQAGHACYASIFSSISFAKRRRSRVPSLAGPLPRSPPAYVDALGNLRVTLTKPSIGASATNGGRTRARRARSDVHFTHHFIRRLALRAKGARARDSTVYGGSSTSAKSFFVHHTQLLAAAAQVGDAKGIRKEVTEKKMRLLKDALKATGRG